MDQDRLAERYRRYIDCLNERRFEDLAEFTEETVVYNGAPCTAADYRDGRIDDFDRIPDLRFVIGLLVVQGELVGARLDFRCTPVREFLGFAPNGRRVEFSEHVFYRFREGRIAEVWSLIDREALRRQLAP